MQLQPAAAWVVHARFRTRHQEMGGANVFNFRQTRIGRSKRLVSNPGYVVYNIFG